MLSDQYEALQRGVYLIGQGSCDQIQMYLMETREYISKMQDKKVSPLSTDFIQLSPLNLVSHSTDSTTPPKSATSQPQSIGNEKNTEILIQNIMDDEFGIKTYTKRANYGNELRGFFSQDVSWNLFEPIIICDSVSLGKFINFINNFF